MADWLEDAISFSDVEVSVNTASIDVRSRGGSTSIVVISDESGLKAEVRGSPENDTLAVSLSSGNAVIYPGAGDDIVRLSGGGTNKIHDAPISQNGSFTDSDSGDDTYRFGTGEDVVYYGSFGFSGSGGHDDINNFERGVDMLVFEENGEGTDIVSVDTTSVSDHTIFHMADGGTIDVDATLTRGVDWILTA
jgi:hypothetical protein